MVVQSQIITALDIIVGAVSFGIGIKLLFQFKEIKSYATLSLSLYTIVYGIGCFLWSIEDAIIPGTLPLARGAYILHYLPAYFGFLFGEFVLKVKPKILIPIGSAIMVGGIASFIIFPLSMEAMNGAYDYHPSPVAGKVLIAVVAMALIPIILFIAYGIKVRKEKILRNKAFILATGLFLVILGEYILFPYGFISLIPAWGIIVAGILILYFGFVSYGKGKVAEIR
jgi:hypothetical protein